MSCFLRVFLSICLWRLFLGAYLLLYLWRLLMHLVLRNIRINTLFNFLFSMIINSHKSNFIPLNFLSSICNLNLWLYLLYLFIDLLWLCIYLCNLINSVLYSLLFIFWRLVSIFVWSWHNWHWQQLSHLCPSNLHNDSIQSLNKFFADD